MAVPLGLRGEQGRWEPSWVYGRLALPLLLAHGSVAAAGGVLLAYLALALLYGALVPPWEAPDEVAHFRYAEQLITTHTLPEQRQGQLEEAHQPPLYYVIAARAASLADLRDRYGAYRPNPHFMWSGKGSDVNAALPTGDDAAPLHGHALALRLMRAVSSLCGAGTVLLTIATGWQVFPSRRSVGVLAGALVAFTPQFLFISATANNDNLLALAAAGAWWQCLTMLRQPQRWQLWGSLGCWVAVALLAKTSGMVVALAAGLFLLYCVARQRCTVVASESEPPIRPLRLFVRGASALLLVPGLAAGWWFVRNALRYGDGFGLNAYSQIYTQDFRTTAFSWHDLLVMLISQFRSFWGLFGWMNVAPPPGFFTGTAVLMALGMAGLIWQVLRHRRHSWTGRAPGNATIEALWLLAGVVTVQEGFLLALATRCDSSCYQGRYLFPVIGPIMLLLSVGLLGLPIWPALTGLVRRRSTVEWAPRRDVAGWLLAGGAGMGLAGAALWLLLQTVLPAYPRPTVPEAAVAHLPFVTDVRFGSQFALRGYQVENDAQSHRLAVTLYWRAQARPDFDYSVFVHLVDDYGQLVAQQDHAPGTPMRYLPTSWLPGDVVVDRHALPPLAQSGIALMDAHAAPNGQVNNDRAGYGCRLRVGVYNWATGERLPALAVESSGAANGADQDEVETADRFVTLRPRLSC